MCCFQVATGWTRKAGSFPTVYHITRQRIYVLFFVGRSMQCFHGYGLREIKTTSDAFVIRRFQKPPRQHPCAKLQFSLMV